MERISVVCFGEILWDILPQVKRPGGAPMNVAYHLQKLGVESKIISRVGQDELGAGLLDFLGSKGLDTQTVQLDDLHDTSAVIASINEAHEVSYEIVYPVAWDFIAWSRDYETLISDSRALVFGSLASRNEVAADTLLKMIEFANYKVFDVNLRAPHYTFEVIDRLLHHTDLLKLNAAEIEMICGWYDANLLVEAEQVTFLFEHFTIKEILITKGASGASYYDRQHSYNSSSFKVVVNDTIGSGDSFLAAFLAQRLSAVQPQKALNYAVGMGAFITSQSGACPEYDLTDFEAFLAKHA